MMDGRKWGGAELGEGVGGCKDGGFVWMEFLLEGCMEKDAISFEDAGSGVGGSGDLDVVTVEGRPRKARYILLGAG